MTSRKLPPLGRLYLWATRRLYNEFAWAYDLAAWIVSLGRWGGWRRLALEYVETGPVLEVGFGTGELLMEMSRRNWPALGIDLSPAMHRISAHKMHCAGLWVPLVRGRTQRMPFDDESCGSIISTFPAEFIVDPVTQQEFARILRPGGRAIIIDSVVLNNSRVWNWSGRLLFGGPSDPLLDPGEKQTTATGLRASVVVRDDPPWQVPVILLEKPIDWHPAS
ncbi:MAG: class I SAM-dependent methyltransferase [Chloroflexota bacterium]|nr:class I SAM-dependent methyltransferase [Chloroflexota bacterium]